MKKHSIKLIKVSSDAREAPQTLSIRRRIKLEL